MKEFGEETRDLVMGLMTSKRCCFFSSRLAGALRFKLSAKENKNSAFLLVFSDGLVVSNVIKTLKQHGKNEALCDGRKPGR
jgi:hypothetical protein